MRGSASRTVRSQTARSVPDTRHPDPHRDDVAQPRRGTPDVQLRAVVVRAGRAGGARAHPLTEPAVRPPTMYFCRKKKNRTSTGIAASTAPAANTPQSRRALVAAHEYRPTASV